MGRRKQQIEEPARRKWKIGIYIRLSREDELAGESGSVKEQKKILLEYVTAYFTEEFEIIDLYTDDGKTGTTDDTRDDFSRMIFDMHAGKINCIVCKTLSRAFRNYADQGRYLEEIFPKYGVRFISVNNPHIDSLNDLEAIQNGLEIPINGLLNDRVAAKTSADVRRTFEGKRNRGEFIGSFAPYGYLKDPEDKNHFIIDENAAAVVKDIFTWFVNDGMSKNGIAKKLNQMGVPNPTKYKKVVQGLKYKGPATAQNDGLWSEGVIAKILKNEMYIGNMVQGKQRVVSYKIHERLNLPEKEWKVVKDTHEAIIGKELFHLAQEIQAKDTKTSPGNSKVHLFAGMLRCADCNKAMRRKKSKEFVYYHCRTYKDKGYCSKHVIREDRLSKAVLQAIRLQISTIESIPLILDKINKKPVGNTNVKKIKHMLTAKEKELSNVAKAIDSLYYDWKCGVITKEQYLRMKYNFENQESRLKENIAAIEKEAAAAEKDVLSDAPCLTEFMKNKNITALDRGILVRMVDTIYVHKDGAVTIDFKFRDEIEQALNIIEYDQNKFEPVQDAPGL